MNVIETLRKRGFIDQITSENLIDATKKPIKVYLGFDPTASSLHLGNLVGIIALSWFQKFGHTPFAIIGGATARIGDPSGKSIERPFLEDKIVENNAFSIGKFLEKILKVNKKGPDPVILNNNDWLKNMTFIDFIRDEGKHFRLSTMLGKESVKLRLASDDGMSFTEFSYQVLQGYDFYHLFTEYGVELQMGGSDQWGNITAGIEFTRKKCGKTIYGLTFPLLTKSDGKKFGKSEEGAIWLDEKMLSYYQFYQYLVKVADADVIRLMKMLTFLDLEEITEIENEMKKPSYVPNTAQKKLAEEVTKFVHGEEGLKVALKVTEGAAPGKEMVLDADNINEIANDMPSKDLSRSEVMNSKFIEISVKTGLVSSKSEATKLIQNGGAYLNNKRLDDSSYVIKQSDIINNKFLILGKGKIKKILVKILD
jgi:tyrosyl-tRNA synthetase